jgi:hypothetical protein
MEARVSYRPPDLRKLFAGSDPARHVREGAADLLERATINGIKREHAALKHTYQTSHSLVVQVEQVRHNPPLWRMRTTQPLVEGGQCVEVHDADEAMLEPEMRMKIRQSLQAAGYFDGAPFKEQWETAKRWASAVVIHRERKIHLLDSENFSGERRR